MVKKGLMMMLGFACYLGLMITPVAARTYDYQPGKQITLKNAGTHYTILNIKTLKQPLPKFDYGDSDELARFMVVQMRVNVAKNNESETIGGYMYEMKEGPNQIGMIDRFEADFKNKVLQEKYYLSWDNTDDGLVVNPGEHQNYDLVFKVYPYNDQVLEIRFPTATSDVRIDRINIKKIQSKNGVTPSLTGEAE